MRIGAISENGKGGWLGQRASLLRKSVRVGLRCAKAEHAVAVREAQTAQLLRLIPGSALVSMATALLLVMALWNEVDHAELLLWLVAVAAFSIFRHLRSLALIRVPARLEEIARKPWRIAMMAACAALLFTVPGLLWFDQVGFGSKIIICMIMTGLMSGGCVSLSSVPLAAFMFVAVLIGGLMGTVHSLGLFKIDALILLFAVSLFATGLSHARRFIRYVVIELELAEKSQLVELLRAFDASGSSWVWELDEHGKVTMMSAEMARPLGHDAKSIIGQPIRTVLDPNGRGFAMSSGFRTFAEHGTTGREFRDLAVPILDGRRWWSLSCKPVRDAAGTLVGWRGVGSDITDARLTGSDSIAAARRDPLTRLANRLLMREMVEEALMRNAAGGPPCVFLLIDLDRFKQVNDTLGHAVGDQLLCQVAQRLKRAADGVGQVARLGGDEFAILMPSGEGTRNLGGFCRDVIDQLSDSYKVGEANLVIGASIGVACGPADGGDDQALIRSADLALYRAKDNGRGRHAFYDPEMLEQAQESRLLESDVRSALVDGQLSLVYQPIVDAVSRAVVGREALLRWEHPERGPIAPDRFIPIIEDLGLIGQIGNWVIHQACADAVHWPDRQRVAVNISVAQLTGATLSATVVAALGATGLDPDRLELEVTESLFLGDDPTTIKSLAGLHALGVRLVLDDFGKGYSSFGYLSRACFSKIKIDRSFVRAAAAGCRQSRAIIGSILALARGLNVETTAEGIETDEEAQLMSVFGCTQLQGFHFGRPVPVDPPPVAGAWTESGDGELKRIVRFG